MFVMHAKNARREGNYAMHASFIKKEHTSGEQLSSLELKKLASFGQGF